MIDIEIPQGKRSAFYRTFEILPLILSILMLLMPVILSFINPVLGAAFIIVYFIIWLVKAVATAYRTIQGYHVLKTVERIDWRKRLADLENPEKALLGARDHKLDKQGFHYRNLDALANRTGAKKPSEIYNAVIIATYNESREVLELTLTYLLENNYDLSHIFLTITYEERGGPAIEETVKALQREYKDKFGEFWITKHPRNIPGEVVGKGGNITYAGKYLAEQIAKKDINPENVIVTTLDSDNRPDKQYFSYVTYEYLIHPDPYHTAFQPLAIFMLNIWDVPAAMRLQAVSNTFINIVNSMRPYALRNFAAHSQSLAALIDMNFWSTRTIVEDGHQFWRSYFRFDGNYQVVPLYMGVYQDAVLAETYKKTLIAQFVQLRRWAYGASDIPYVAERVLTRKRTVPLVDGLLKLFRLFDSHVSWASASLILLLGAFAPLIISSQSSRSLAAHQLPNLASNLQRIAMISLVVMMFFMFKLLPKRPARYSWRRTAGMVLQWILVPVTGIIYGSAAAFYSQTRLATGKYMDKFDVTEKAMVRSQEKKTP